MNEMTVSCREGTRNDLRNSNIELFRIITMVLIVAHYYVVNSGLVSAGGPIGADVMSWRSLFLLEFGAFGKTGINCFVLITGYFMCKSKITSKKFCKLLFEIEFYKIIIWAIFLLSGYEAFSVKGLLNALLPIQSVSTGFISCYLLFFLCIPFLNILIHSMNEKQHIRLLLLLSFIYIFIGSIPKINVTMNYVSWFIVIYFIGSYIRLYERDLFNRTKLWGVLSLIFVIASLVSVVALSWIGSKFGYSGLHYFFLADSNKILAVVLSVSAFLFFKNIKIKQSKIINIVAGSTFGVLLIHANSETMRSWLWKDTLGNVGMYSSMWMPIHAIGSVVAIFTVCTAIDILRVNFIEKPFFILWDKVFPKVSNWFCDKEDVLLNKLKIQK